MIADIWNWSDFVQSLIISFVCVLPIGFFIIIVMKDLRKQIKRRLFLQFIFWLRKPRIFTTNKHWADTSIFQFGEYPPESSPMGMPNISVGWTLSILGIINGILPKFGNRKMYIEGFDLDRITVRKPRTKQE